MLNEADITHSRGDVAANVIKKPLLYPLSYEGLCYICLPRTPG